LLAVGSPSIALVQVSLSLPMPLHVPPGLPTVEGRIPEPVRQKDTDPLVLEVASVKID
jgi:hypothetical protein